MSLKVVKKGFNYSQDGPGNRLVYHLAGCNMKCPWCANPEAMQTDCESKVYLPSDFLAEVSSAAPIFFDGGGVTFTGGEPTLFFDELKETLTLLKKSGFDIAIESNATSPRFPELFSVVDHIICDFKHYDDEKHKKITGVTNKTVKANIEAAAKRGVPLLIRTPLINGFNSSKEDAEGFLNFYKSLKTDSLKFELLKYHEYGKVKWEKLGRKYAVSDGFVTDETLSYFENLYKQNGLFVVRT